MRRLALALIVLLLPLSAGAEKSGVTGPVITQGKGEECVADTDYMRRFHMVELVHQQNRVVQEGVRTTRFSLNGCVACHAGKDDSGAFVPVNAPGQFCAACHEYTAVTIDCFQCHAAKPDDMNQTLAPFPLVASAGECSR